MSWLRWKLMRQAEDDLKERIGRELRRLREQRSQTQAAIAAAVEMSPEAYGRLERGESYPSAANLVRFAQLFGVSADALLGIEGRKQHSDGLVTRGASALSQIDRAVLLDLLPVLERLARQSRADDGG